MELKNKLVNIMSVVLLCAVLIATGAFASCGTEDDSDEKHGAHIEAESDGKKDEKAKADFTVVLDAGHGGVDPGKVGVDGQLEKDINLQIVMQLKEILESNEEYNIEVILTRDKDEGHYSETDSNKKMTDMKKRCQIVEESEADVLVSIHQNSYHSSSVKGAQVFYYEKSAEGHKMAMAIQNKLVESLADNGKGRVEKSNDNYYILLNVSCPAVIVECGFLSNPGEASKLATEEYQKQVAKAIAEGVVEYFNGGKQSENKEITGNK